MSRDSLLPGGPGCQVDYLRIRRRCSRLRRHLRRCLSSLCQGSRERLTNGAFNSAPLIYARPLSLKAGDQIDEQTLIAHLRRAGYSDERKEGLSSVGPYRVTDDSVMVKPGAEAGASRESAVVRFDGARISAISTSGGAPYHTAFALNRL